jgi:deoxyribodipyrimidine photolyase
MAFRVLVDDNFHYQDESERYDAGVYDNLDEAIRVCRGIVDRDLAHQYQPGMTADELYHRYTSFRKDPFITDTDGAGRPRGRCCLAPGRTPRRDPNRSAPSRPEARRRPVFPSPGCATRRSTCRGGAAEPAR